LLTFSAHAQPDQMRFDPHVTSALTCSQQQAVCVTGDITHTHKAEGFDASEDGTGRGQPIVAAFAENSRAELRYEGGDGSRVGTLSTGGGMAVRRLTPRECERLQAFPDDYTLIPMPDRRTPPPRGDRRDGPRMAADGPRYKALGNSMCVNNMRWLGIRLMLTHCFIH
jgi:DNA (cytosine-5)-methyltransferase 1